MPKSCHVLRHAGLVFVSLLMVAGIGVQSASAQAEIYSTVEKARIWELKLGTPVTQLPKPYGDPHCGTNGGPESTRLDSWADFAKCPKEPATGLHEIWFTEDDEQEYVELALRILPLGRGPVTANLLFNHKVIYSVLADDAGTVQGYRVFTDPHEDPDNRVDAQLVGASLVQLYGEKNFQCTDAPMGQDEQPVDGDYINQTCTAVVDDKHILIERHLFRKPGQKIFDPVTHKATIGYFESTTHMEVIAANLVKK